MKTAKLAFYNKPFPRIQTFYDLIDCCVAYGLPAYEGFCHMELTEPDIDAAKKIRAYADENGVTCCCFSVYANITGDDAAAQVERMKGFADVAAVLGSPFIHHTIAPQPKEAVANPDVREKMFWLGIEGIRAIYDHAIQKGVRAIYEDQAFIFNGVAGFGRFLKEVDRDIGVVADFGNIFQMNERVEPFIEAYGDRVVHVHLKDMLEVPETYPDRYPTWGDAYCAEIEFGHGEVNFEAAIAALRKFGYDGYYGMEYGAKSDDSTAVDEMVAFSRNLLA